MRIHEERTGAVTVIRPEGALVGSDADELKARLAEAFSEAMGRCVLDASAISYVDSKGLEALVEANEKMASVGKALKLCGANETVRQVLELTRLLSHFEHFEDAGSAVRSFL